MREAQCTDAAGIARVHVESWRTTYRGTVPSAYLDVLSAEQRRPSWERQLCSAEGRTSVFIAVDATTDEIAGFASGGPEQSGTIAEYPWELYAIYLLAGRQRRGAGRLLVTALVQRLRERGARELLLWVLAENQPARRFYEALGGTVVRERSITIGGADLAEIAYGWTDLEALQRHAADR
ncbi:MAG TPA: GNAT family N-acetyltransferase [Dehalococcoidia bacterium]